MGGRLLTLARSPLLHFLLIGAVIYLLYGVSDRETASVSPDTITVTAGDIGWMEDSWQKRWNRPPTPQERKGLIDQYVRETVLYREALAMGLEKDDVIIRRRLAQKLEFLFQDLADAVPPDEPELRAYFETNRDRYQDPELLTFTHVFLDPDRRGEQTLADAEAMLAELRAQDDPTRDAADLGDLFMLQSYYPQRPELEISKLFGWEFARSVFELEPGQWHGPVLSGYGVHLVYVHDRLQAPPPSFDAVVERVTEDWQTDRRQAFNDEFVENLMGRYEVTIEDDPSNEVVAKR
jgi:hypothetical protein